MTRRKSANTTQVRTETVRTTLAGLYQRKQGKRETYKYAGAYGVNSEGTWWLVTVRSQGRVKGAPIGVLPNERAPRVEFISRLIERQIEELDQVRE
jgi:hypothetical protein